MEEFFIKPSPPVPLDFPPEMLQELHLSTDPHAICAKHGYDYEQIKDLPHFKTKLHQIEQALLVEGALTPVIAAAGLHAAVEKLAYRVQDDRIPTGDLVKAIDILKKVKDGVKEDKVGATGPSFQISIVLPGHTDKSKAVTVEGTAQTLLVEAVDD